MQIVRLVLVMIVCNTQKIMTHYESICGCLHVLFTFNICMETYIPTTFMLIYGFLFELWVLH